MDRKTGLILWDPFDKDGGLIMFLGRKFENKIFLNYLAWFWAIWKEYKKKEHNQPSSEFKEFKNNDL